MMAKRNTPFAANTGLAGAGEGGGGVGTASTGSAVIGGSTGSITASAGTLGALAVLAAARKRFFLAGGLATGWAISGETGDAAGGGCSSTRNGTGSAPPPNNSTSVPNRAAP